jgi:hypothetical protein
LLREGSTALEHETVEIGGGEGGQPLRTHGNEVDEAAQGFDHEGIALVSAVVAHLPTEKAGADADSGACMRDGDRLHAPNLRRQIRIGSGLGVEGFPSLATLAAPARSHGDGMFAARLQDSFN